LWDAEQQWPDETNLPDYCKTCRATGGCDACPKPHLLPECLPALRAWDTCSTQMRVSFAGTTGLDYGACIATLALYLPRWKALAPPGDALHGMEVADLLDDLRTIEDALLTAWAEQAAEKRGDPPPE
jgi:hypothetical protein